MRVSGIMELNKKSLLFLLVLSLLMSCILSRPYALENQESSAQLRTAQMASRGAHLMEKYFGRMTVEVNDYPGSGANTRHDPKSPGTPV